MLTAILGGLGDLLKVAAGSLERFGLFLERTPLGPFWPVGFVVVFYVLTSMLSVVVWLWRGRVWPVACDYPRTTTRGRQPCRNRVLGEWSRCHYHRKRWTRATDHHEIDPNLRRWQTIRRGKTVERTDLEGSGFVRRQSNLIGILYYKGFARPPEDVRRLLPQLVRDYRARLVELWAAFQQRRHRGVQVERQSQHASASVLAPGVVVCTQFILLVLAVAFAIVIAAVLLRTLQPDDKPARVTAEYAAAFSLFLAASAFRGGILGQHIKPGVWQPQTYWLANAQQEATATFFVTLVTGWTFDIVRAVKSEIPAFLVVVALLAMLASRPRNRRRRPRPTARTAGRR
jgi:energy-converting hydrogenase Eha subunit A